LEAQRASLEDGKIRVQNFKVLWVRVRYRRPSYCSSGYDTQSDLWWWFDTQIFHILSIKLRPVCWVSLDVYVRFISVPCYFDNLTPPICPLNREPLWSTMSCASDPSDVKNHFGLYILSSSFVHTSRFSHSISSDTPSTPTLPSESSLMIIREHLRRSSRILCYQS
jgi:hypothetical protein